MAISVRELQRRHGAEDVKLGQAHQDAQRRAGAPVQPLSAILGGKAPAAPPVDLTGRQLRRRGTYGQAALLTDQAALGEADPSRAFEAREASAILKKLSQSNQLEFNFWKGNMVQADQYHDAIVDRLNAAAASSAERTRAIAILSEIKRWLAWQDFTCTKTAAELGDRLGLNKTDMSLSLALLEKVGAIGRAKRGRTKLITVTPEGAFRGDINTHNAVMERYKAEVVQLHPANQ